MARITNVLGALRPHLDDRSITFFASIALSELLELGKDGMWHLPASKLSAGWLQEFGVKKMSEEISLMAPGLSSVIPRFHLRWQEDSKFGGDCDRG